MHRICYAHSVEGCRPEDGWEAVEDHLRLVAEGVAGGPPGAARLAEGFHAEAWGALAGWWHDLGKYSDAFQDYLLSENGFEAHLEQAPGRVDHSTFGAKHAWGRGPVGQMLAYCIAGHHGGMPNYAGDLGLQNRLLKTIPEVRHLPSGLLDMPVPRVLPISGAGTRAEQAFQCAFLTRMVFSALVDADFLATEWFMRPDQRGSRQRTQATVAELRERLDGYLDDLAARARGRGLSPVNARRAEVLGACREAAAHKPGLFSLTVPTGGGKTLSSLAFALRHAERHGLRRVIYAIPFTSIIEQNAEAFREALGPLADAVLEHHSNFEPKAEDPWSRLASENWDAPLVVTTTVQLYESLFHNKPSQCRKLHSVARSVIVLDEAQTIPVPLLRPTLAALRELVQNYGCSIVLCTATQPAVVQREGFEIGLPEAREIVPDVGSLFAALRRVRVEPAREMDDGAIVAALAEQPQALCVVGSRREARELFQQLRDVLDEQGLEPDDPGSSCVHLSTWMCPEHRSATIARVRQRLNDGLACRVISTTLIEAGVDLDFPVVFRAMAGLDSIAQAAGRCNREGRLPGLGRVALYTNLSRIPKSARKNSFTYEQLQAAQITSGMLGDFPDPLHPEAIEAYFREYYWKREPEWDAKDVMSRFKLSGSEPVFDFADAADRYRVIDDAEMPVVVGWGEAGAALLKTLRELHEPAGRELRRRCQRFAVGVRDHDFGQLLAMGGVVAADEKFARGVYVLNDPGLYDAWLGLRVDAVGIEPEGLTF